MTSPRDAMEALTRAIANEDRLPKDLSVLLQEADTSYEDADVDLPLLEVQMTNVDFVVLNNTDRIGFVEDSDGNQTGQVFAADWEMTVQLDIWTTKNGGYDPDELGEALRKSIYPFSSYGPERPLLDTDLNPIEDVNYLRMNTGDRADDLLQTPSVRKWTQTVEMWGCEQFRTSDEFVTIINTPGVDDYSGDGTGQIDST